MDTPDLPRVSVQIVVRNGERYLRHCLDAVLRQTYRNLELLVLDNASTDTTPDIVAREYPQFRLFRHPENVGMWPGHEHLLTLSTGEYVLALSVDVILDRDCIARMVAAMSDNPSVGAIQAKVYQYRIDELGRQGMTALTRRTLDTCGFALTRGRRIMNIGHGEFDLGFWETRREIFGVEGALPFFRRSMLLSCAIEGHIWDPDYFWYGDDLDLAWRMHLFGFLQLFVPDAVAWHDRSTTKGTASIPVLGQLRRLRLRRAIPLAKRRLDWSNTRFTIIKNDSILNILRDLPWIVLREAGVIGYSTLFERAVFGEAGRFFRLLPRMLRRRRKIMRRAKVSAREMHRWFR